MWRKITKVMADKRKKISPIKVRYKELADGSKSIYLDYMVGEQRISEYLKLYLLPGRSAEVKRLNGHTRRAVTSIIAQRMTNLAWDKDADAGIEDSRRLLTEVSTEYGALRARRGSKGAKNRFRLLNFHIRKVNARIRMWEVNLDFVKALADHMMKKERTSTGEPLAKATITNHIAALSSVMSYAMRKGMVKENPVELFDYNTIEGPVHKRNYLIVEELKRLVETPCSNEQYKNLFIFGCFVGLRYSDLRTLRWKDIIEENGETRIEKMMSKTGHMVYIPLNRTAMMHLPARRDYEDLVFTDLPAGISSVDTVIKEWAKEAGIRKTVSFYTARHTFATLTLTQGADLFAVSQLMGHKDISTTQGYAEIIDVKKEIDISLIDELFDDYRTREKIPAGNNAESNGLLNLGWELKRPMSDVIDTAHRYFQKTSVRDLGYHYNLLKSYFEQFRKDMRICDITEESTSEFVAFLQGGATDENGRKLCRMKVEEAIQTYEDTLRVAVKHGWLKKNYAFDIDRHSLNGRVSFRSDLTNEELDILDATPCDTPALKEVFLLCCYCNLSHEEAFALRWSNITRNERGRMMISLYSPRNSTQTTFTVPVKAEHLLPERTDPTDLVFHPLSTETKAINDAFRLWTRSSLLERRVTFNIYKETYMRVYADRRNEIRNGR